MNKLLIITGPTATGKTSLAVFLAKKFKGELISADSRQVFKGMDIGTGKDHPVGFPLYLIDVVNPNQKFSVHDYCRLAKKEIDKIWQNDKLPILVGGTGFYIKGLLEGIETAGIKPDWPLRKRMEKLEIEKLQEKLKEVDLAKWQNLNQSDRQNPHRLIRIIEISQAKKTKTPLKPLKVDLLKIGLALPLRDLYQKIDKRVEERVKLGVEKEIKTLLGKGFSFKNSALGSTLGYQEWEPFLKGEVSKEEVIKGWQFKEHAYARRQMTWFRKEKEINWFKIDKKNWGKEVEKLVETWYGKFDVTKN